MYRQCPKGESSRDSNRLRRLTKMVVRRVTGAWCELLMSQTCYQIIKMPAIRAVNSLIGATNLPPHS